MQRVLAVDVGTVRVGVAISDPLGMTAQPLEVIERKRVDPFARLAALIDEWEVTQVVIGLPLTLAGDESHAAKASRSFADELRKRIHVPIEMFDERLTTAAAERSMIEGGARRDRRKENIDKIAAALLLQAFLDSRPRNPSS